MKSYMISYVFSRLPGPVQKRPRSGSNAPRFESNAADPRPLRLSVLFGFEIRLQWFISPFKASQTLGPHPPPPLPPPRRPLRHHPHAQEHGISSSGISSPESTQWTVLWTVSSSESSGISSSESTVLFHVL